MQYVSSVERIGLQRGLQQGLDSERQLLLRLVRRRFGETAAAASAPRLARIAAPAVLEDLGEALLDCADGAAWLARLESIAMANNEVTTDDQGSHPARTHDER